MVGGANWEIYSVGEDEIGNIWTSSSGQVKLRLVAVPCTQVYTYLPTSKYLGRYLRDQTSTLSLIELSGMEEAQIFHPGHFSRLITMIALLK